MFFKEVGISWVFFEALCVSHPIMGHMECVEEMAYSVESCFVGSLLKVLARKKPKSI